ncbi:MAG: ROK family protein, partial [Chloroflexota bacterium]|nr:ROK family protein [Chloroflexota bacterium]
MIPLASAPRTDEPGGVPVDVLALDLGGTRLRTAVVRADGRLSGRRVSPTPRADAEALVQACVAQL